MKERQEDTAVVCEMNNTCTFTLTCTTYLPTSLYCLTDSSMEIGSIPIPTRKVYQ